MVNKCYLCNSSNFTQRKGKVRDDPNILFAKDESAELSSVDCKQISSLTNAIPLLNSKMPLREAL